MCRISIFFLLWFWNWLGPIPCIDGTVSGRSINHAALVIVNDLFENKTKRNCKQGILDCKLLHIVFIMGGRIHTQHTEQTAISSIACYIFLMYSIYRGGQIGESLGSCTHAKHKHTHTHTHTHTAPNTFVISLAGPLNLALWICLIQEYRTTS